MSAEEKLVAIVSPWDSLSKLVKNGFRLESLPAEKQVMVWREDLQREQRLSQELQNLGINTNRLMKKKVTTKWQDRE